MSTNMLGDTLRDICGPLGDFNQKLAGPNGEEWFSAFKRFLRKENPWGTLSPFVPSRDPATGLYRWSVNYDETIEEKLATFDSATIGWATSRTTDKKFPDKRTGTKIVTGRLFYPGKDVYQNEFSSRPGITPAQPKELIDFVHAFPPLTQKNMHIVATGQFWEAPAGSRCYLYVYWNEGCFGANHTWLTPTEKWNGRWRFLVLCDE